MLTILLLFSCRSAPEKVSDPLEMFPLNSEWQFVGSQNQDGIILLLKRTEQNKLSYRVEVMKNYLGLPLENGTITLNDAGNDTVNFSGGNDDCRVTIKMYESNEEPVGKRIVIEQICRDSAQNIRRNDFPPLHLRRNR